MTTVLLTQRVAWAWMDKLLGRPSTDQPEAVLPPAKARGALLEKAYDQLRDGLVASIRSELPALLRAQDAIAAKYGLDPTFLDWFLINGKHWPPMAPKLRKALRAIQSTRLWFGAVPSQWSHMVVPEADQGDDRDAALVELADWFVKNSLAKIGRRFVGDLWKKSRELLHVFGAPQGQDARASSLLLLDFTKRLAADSFQLKPAVQQIVDLLG